MARAETIPVLGISGSINPGGTAARLLHAVSRLAPLNLHFSVFEGIGDIPHFNPQLALSCDSENLAHFRALCRDACAILICTPEYAFGMPGTLKNALDWLVSSGELYHKPLAALSYSPSYMGGEKALSTLALTLTAQNANFDEHTTLSIPFVRQKLDLEGRITDEELNRELASLLSALAAKIV